MSNPDEETMLLRFRERFPDEARATDAWVAERGLEGPFHWLESFADRTTEAIFSKDRARVIDHTTFLRQEYLHGSSAVRYLIDVSYTESLMWDATQPDKCWAWPHIAAPIRTLYAGMWGEPDC